MINPFDVESSRFPDGSPYRKTSQLISWAIGETFGYYTDPDFISALQEQLNETTLLVVINGKFDIGWLRRIGARVPMGLRVWDCQLAEYVLSGQTNSFVSMDVLCNRYGIRGKEGGLEEWWGQGIETRDIPREHVETYNLGDTSRTIQIYHAQLADPRMTDKLKKLILLQGLDLLVLQQMEENGILYDKEGSITKGNEVQEELAVIQKELQDVIQFPYFNLDSNEHLSCFLYGGTIEIDVHEPTELVYKSGSRKGETYVQNKFKETIKHEFRGYFKPLPRTALKKAGYYQTGEPILKQLPARTKGQRFVIERLLKQAELSKQVGSFLHALPELAVKKGWCDESAKTVILHPTYHQVVARTGRLSCSQPNAQQFPEEVDKYWITRYL